jgi:hypothetical protein
MSIVSDPTPTPTTCAARALTHQQRRDLALDCLGGRRRRCISRLAREHQVSRKFLYQQRHIAQQALDHAFRPAAPPDRGVLFHLPVTGSWLRQFVLVCVLVGHSSLRGAQEMLDCLLGLPASFGWAHSVVKDAIDRARAVNDAQDLSPVQAVALDEIFQNGKPVLAAVDVHSTHCCLLTQEEHRDADTWALRLLELRDKGFAPRQAVADFGTGLRAGSRIALPWLGDCDADVWHPLRDLGEVVRFLENKAYAAIDTYDKLCRRPKGAPPEQVAAARSDQDRAIALSDDVATLLGWLRGEVLSLAGPCLADRRESFGVVLEELVRLRPGCERRLGPVCSTLASGREQLLGFCARLDREMADLASYAKVSEAVLREMVSVQEMADGDRRKWQRDAALRQELGGRHHELSGLVEALRRGVVRASSVVENLNGRLRNYFFLRKEIGGGYLELLRFFLNHRRFLRSEHPQRVGKSPAELLNGSEHAHWLELLGYRRFNRDQAAAA